MPKSPEFCIPCEFFTWNVFKRSGIFYADGRGNKPPLRKYSLATRDRSEALRSVRLLDRRIAIDHKLAKPAATSNLGDIPIADVWSRYLAFCARPAALGGTGATTQKRYRAVKDKHQKFCQEQGIEFWNQIDKNSVTAYGTWLAQQDYSCASLYLECTLIKQLIKWLIEEDKTLPESHRIRLRLHRSHESDCYCYSRKQVQAMIERCNGIPHLVWLGRIITALACTGMRIGELVHLRWTEVDLAAQVIQVTDNRHSARSHRIGTVTTSKGRRSRKIPIHSHLRPVLKCLERDGQGTVFVGPQGGLLKADVIREVLIAEVLNPLKETFPTPPNQIGFEHGRLHSFRHFFVSEAFLGGASEGEIREWVGHRNSRIVERYRHLNNEDARRKMDQILFFTESEKVEMGAAQKVNNASRP